MEGDGWIAKTQGRPGFYRQRQGRQTIGGRGEAAGGRRTWFWAGASETMLVSVAGAARWFRLPGRCSSPPRSIDVATGMVYPKQPSIIAVPHPLAALRKGTDGGCQHVQGARTSLHC